MGTQPTPPDQDLGLGRIMDRRHFVAGSLSASAALLLAAGLGSSSASAASDSAAKGPSPTKDGDSLNLYAWEGYFAPKAISRFESKYGIKVTQTDTASLDQMLTTLTAKQPFDVMINNSTYLPQVTGTGLLQVIDPDKLTNYGQVVEDFRKPYYDPSGLYAIPYAIGGCGVAYNDTEYHNVKGSWADIWENADSHAGHVYLLDDSQLALQIALAYLGLNQNTSSKTDLNKAAEAIIQIKSKLGGFASTDTTQVIASGQATMLPSYYGNVFSAIQKMGHAGKDIKLKPVKVGSLFNADNLTIPSAAQHPGNAMLFIDYMLSPEVMAENVNYIAYPVPTKAGLAAYDTLVKEYPFLKIDTSTLNNANQWQQGLTATQRPLWNAAWLKVQAA
jgi:spermidine/putrescine transport system substrate-binding protein